MRVVVVGAGLFGSIIAAHLRTLGHEVTVVADQREGMGSTPAACLMKPSWASNMPAEDYDAAINLLSALYGVKLLEFDMPPFRAIVTAHWVDPKAVLQEPDRLARALDWGEGWVELGNVETGVRGDMLTAEHVIFATGQWADDFTTGLELTGKGGWSFLVEGRLQGRGMIRPWAPYKQLVFFQIAPDVVWVGDGSALKAESMTQDRERASRERCLAALDGRLLPLGSTRKIVTLKGFRPYVKGLKEPACIRPVGPRQTVVTGGAKNGTLGAAWAARRIGDWL